jgi:hypothetical protein
VPPPKGFISWGGGKKGREEKNKRFDSKSSVHAVAYLYLAGSRLFFVIPALTKKIILCVSVCERRFLFPLFLLAYYSIFIPIFSSVEFLHLLLPVIFLTQTTPLNYAGPWAGEGGTESGEEGWYDLGCKQKQPTFRPDPRPSPWTVILVPRGRLRLCEDGPSRCWSMAKSTCLNQGLRRNFYDDPRSTSCMSGFVHAIHWSHVESPATILLWFFFSFFGY